jgi:hypothetical protein
MDIWRYPWRISNILGDIRGSDVKEFDHGEFQGVLEVYMKTLESIIFL